AAAAHRIPVYAVCGRTTLDPEQLANAGIRHTVALVDLVKDPG
ncbi:glycerate kinase, partial [Glutamicibacter creatinolyticus]